LEEQLDTDSFIAHKWVVYDNLNIFFAMYPRLYYGYPSFS